MTLCAKGTLLLGMVFIAWLNSPASARSIRLPSPTGPYTVGTEYLAFVDNSRPEIFTDTGQDRRVVTCRAWYPTVVSPGAESAPYLLIDASTLEDFRLPSELLDITTNSVMKAPFAYDSTAWPVLVYSHGWGEFAEHFSSLMEELASHGFVVFSVAHHFEAKFWAYPDGQAGTINAAGAALQRRLNEQKNEEVWRLFEAMPVQNKAEDQRRLLRETTRLLPSFFAESPRIWSDDLLFFMDCLDSLNSHPGRYYQRMNLGRVGVLGMSMGGIASVLTAVRDRRVRAVINIDGGLYGDVLDSLLGVPCMFLSSDRYRLYASVFLDHVKAPALSLTVSGSDHMNFSDCYLYPAEIPMLGPIDGGGAITIIRAMAVKFLETHLCTTKAGFSCEAARQFPEIQCSSRH